MLDGEVRGIAGVGRVLVGPLGVASHGRGIAGSGLRPTAITATAAARADFAASTGFSDFRQSTARLLGRLTLTRLTLTRLTLTRLTLT
jgi:hypothetical protein